MHDGRLDMAAAAGLHRRAQADRWGLPLERFAAALETSLAHALGGGPASREDVARYVASLHVEDLALASACAEGTEAAWDFFVREYRPALYRAADAIDPSGGARELADSLYAELFGLSERDGVRRSHFRYFHGRSSLTTWLRAVLAQRHVDGIRRVRRLDPLPPDETPHAIPATTAAPTPDHARHLAVLRRALSESVAQLAPRDRLRLTCYYAQALTLAQIGQALGEHEATVSRNLTRARRTIRESVERALRDREGMGDAEIAECFETAVEDVGALDVAELLDDASPRKEVVRGRSR